MAIGDNGNYLIIIPIMITSILGTIIAKSLYEDSIDTWVDIYRCDWSWWSGLREKRGLGGLRGKKEGNLPVWWGG